MDKTTPDESQMVLFERDDAVATLTLNRPASMNALDIRLAEQLLEHALRCAADPTIRCVVLTGSGRAFCAGGDVTGFRENANALGSYLDALIARVHETANLLMQMDKPLVCLVNGPAAGAGLSLALMGDLVIAGRSASFLAAYGGVGLTPDGGLSWLLPRLVGMRKAQEMIISNRRVGVDDAAAIGLVNCVVDDEALREEGLCVAHALAHSATGAIAQARALLLSSYETTFEDQLERERKGLIAAGGRDEAREGVAAFLEGRRPDFVKGKGR